MTTSCASLPLVVLLATAAVGCFQSVPDKEPPSPSAASVPAPASARPPLPNDPAARQARLAEIATLYAIERGHRRDSIRVTSVKEANGRARVAFNKEPRRPGSHFTVIVDAASGKVADFIPGM